MVWDDLGRGAEDDNKRDRDKWIGVWIGILAVVLAIATLGGGNATKDATIKNIEATNMWAFFQAKNMRRHTLRVQAEALDLRLKTEAGLSEPTKAEIQKVLDSYRAQDKQLTSDPKSNEGLDELWTRAKALEKERDLAMAKDPYFDYAQALLQIAIILASVAIITGGSFLLGVSLLVGLAGAFVAFNGYTMMFALPFL
jgi:hypothetical protein